LRRSPSIVRFIAATNRDLEAAIRRGTFREDLFYRLNGFSIAIPPLRDRVTEIEPLARYFVAEFVAATRDTAIRSSRPPGWLAGSLPLARQHSRAAQPDRAGGAAVQRLRDRPTAPAARQARDPAGPAGRALRGSRRRAGRRASPPTEPVPSVRAGFHDQRDQFRAALDQCGGNKTRAAVMLGISHRTLANRLNTYDLERARKSQRGGSDPAND